MGVRRVEANGQDLEDQNVITDPQAVIDSLVARVQALTMELVMKDAMIAQLRSREDAHAAPDHQPE